MQKSVVGQIKRLKQKFCILYVHYLLILVHVCVCVCDIVYLYAWHVYPHTVITKIICKMSLRYDVQKDTLNWILALRPYHPCLLKSAMTPSPDCRLRLPLLHVMCFLKTVQFNKNVLIEKIK